MQKYSSSADKNNDKKIKKTVICDGFACKIINDNKKIFDFEIANVASPKSLKGTADNQDAQNQNQQLPNSSGSQRPAGATIAPPVLPKLEPVDMN